MGLISKNPKYRALNAALGLEVPPIPTNQITAVWIDGFDQLLVSWSSVNVEFLESTNSLKFSTQPVSPSFPGQAARQRILINNVAEHEDDITVTDNNGVTVVFNQILATDRCSFEMTSSVADITNLGITEDCKRRMARAVSGLGSESVSGLTYRLVGANNLVLVSWDFISVVEDDIDLEQARLDISATAASTIASGTYTNFQVLNGNNIELNCPAANFQLTLDGESVTEVIVGQPYSVSRFTFFM